MPVSMLPPRPAADTERFQQLNDAMRNERCKRRAERTARNFERLKKQAAQEERKALAALPLPASHETLYGSVKRGMPWCRPCFLCDNPAWCRHRESELIKLYRPPEMSYAATHQTRA
jgi:hypothetical protein